MLKFDEQKLRDNIKGALKLRSHINDIVDKLYPQIKNICFLGIGGTYASSMQVVNHMQEMTAHEVICQSAAEYLTTGNKRIQKGTLMVVSSVSGNTQEMVEAVQKAKKDEVTIIGFIDVSDSTLANLVDYEIAYPMNEQLKFFMVADRIMNLEGTFQDYDQYYLELDEHLVDILIDVRKKSDTFALDFAQKHHEDPIHYFVGSGSQWGATYSYGMCYWEEQHWLKTKTIHASEFFHGMFEIVEKDTNVTVFVTEDKQRSLGLRVANFLPQICARYTIIDTADYALEGISKQYRGYISHLVIRAICERIDVHIEKMNCHPMEIRRYYRQLEY